MSAGSTIPKHIEEVLATHRRGFLKSAGHLIESFGGWAPGANAQEPGPYPNPDFRQIDSWIVIHENNMATFYVGKTDPDQGTGTDFRQLMSDELDIPFDKTACIMGSTDITVDEIGSGGSTAMEGDSWPPAPRFSAPSRHRSQCGDRRSGCFGPHAVEGCLLVLFRPVPVGADDAVDVRAMLDLWGHIAVLALRMRNVVPNALL